MINLQIAIFNGDAQSINFTNVNELVGYIKECNRIKAVWLAVDDTTNDILVTESIEQIIKAILFDFWDLSFDKNSTFYLQEYQSYEDAYAVSLSMKETNPKCFNV